MLWTLARSFLIGSSSWFMQVTRTTIKSQMSLKFGQIRPWTAELAALERLKNPHRLTIGDHSNAFNFDWNFFILAGNKDLHLSWDVLEFQPDLTTDYGVTCPWASEKSMYNFVNTLAPSFLLETSSFLQVTKTNIKSQMSSKFSQFQPWTAEIAALDQLKKSFTYLRTIQNILMTCWFSGDRPLPFGPLVSKLTRSTLGLWCVIFFANLQQSYGPWFTSEVGFCSISWDRTDKMRPNFVYTLSLNEIYVGIINRQFCKFAKEILPLIDVRICFLLNILSTTVE